MLERAGQALRAGHSVVLDAVFARPEERQMAEALARKVGRAVRGPVARRAEGGGPGPRRRPQGADASDATPAVVERQFGYDLGEISWRR